MKMQKWINSNTIRFLSLVLLTVLATSNIILQAQNKNDVLKPQVFHIQNYFSEAYLVKGNTEKLILIETGVPVAGYQDSLINSIKRLGFKPEHIALAIVTHGHGDHAGNARFLQRTFHIPIAAGKGDLNKFTSGRTELSKSEDVSIWGSRLRPYSDLSYEPFTPDIIVDNVSIDLSTYGVNGKIIPIQGGHTPGDLLILIGENLFVGDAFVGTFKAQGGGLAPDGHQVREHFFHENKQLADQNLKRIEKIAIDHKVKTLYPTHNGPVSIDELTKYIQEEPLLKILSSQETEMLIETVKGKPELQTKHLADNFMLQTAKGDHFTKAEFIQAYITHPKIKIESLAAEDFRIVTANEHSAVMTYLETIKLEGKEATTVSVAAIYSKSKEGWKLVYKKICD
jgi:glyoxylase-like metal-dependent hydrolase (beta-lactamase superfamily II)